jgi:hypothetical protein
MTGTLLEGIVARTVRTSRLDQLSPSAVASASATSSHLSTASPRVAHLNRH